MSTCLHPKVIRDSSIVSTVVSLGEFVASRRRALGLSQRSLAKKAGLSSAAVSKIESGLSKELRASTLQALADALEISVMELMVLNQGEPPPTVVTEIPQEILDFMGQACTRAFMSALQALSRSLTDADRQQLLQGEAISAKLSNVRILPEDAQRLDELCAKYGLDDPSMNFPVLLRAVDLSIKSNE